MKLRSGFAARRNPWERMKSRFRAAEKQKPPFDLGLNFAQINDFRKDPDLLNRYVDCAYDMGLTTLRLPVYWGRMQTYDPKAGTFTANSEFADMIGWFLDRIPQEIEPMALLFQTTPAVAARYFHEPQAMPQIYAQFVDCVLDAAPRISSFELWNEPNANDFYLSVADGDGHRPWTAEEFLSHILIPGATTIRKRRPDAKICFGSFAENGIVGHPAERQAPPARQLPHREPYRTMKAAAPKGFHFIPDFAVAYFDALKRLTAAPGEGAGIRNLFDAFAIHPYPYFRLTPDRDYADHSADLTADFIALADRSGFSDKEIWITEVGCRTADKRRRHMRDEDHQREFVDRFCGSVDLGGRITRLYWYKFNDLLHWDMKMRKSFGMIDHYRNTKRVYFGLRHLKPRLAGATSRPVLLDNFDYGLAYASGSVDPDFWDVDIAERNIAGFHTVSRDGAGRSEVLLFAGNRARQKLSLTSKLSLAGRTNDAPLLIGACLRTIDKGAANAISLALETNGDRLFGMTFDLQEDAVSMRLPGRDHPLTIDRTVDPDFDPMRFSHYFAVHTGQVLYLAVLWPGRMAYVPLARKSIPDCSGARLVLRLTKKDASDSFVALRHIIAASTVVRRPLETAMLQALDPMAKRGEWTIEDVNTAP